MWEAEQQITPNGPCVVFQRRSPAGEEGYPGTVHVKVTYCLTNDNTLRIDMEAQTDESTPLNMAHHTYWNLGGHTSGNILEHEVTLNSTQLTATDENLIPTGEIQDVSETCRDLSKGVRVGEATDRMRLEETEAWEATNGGFDFNYVVNNSGWGKVVPAAKVYDPASGRVMEVLSNQPGVQFYTGSWLPPSLAGKAGAVYDKYGGLCVETQLFPDGINQEENPAFPSVVLKPGELYHHIMIHKFSVL